jgi:hypothetical protein
MVLRSSPLQRMKRGFRCRRMAGATRPFRLLAGRPAEAAGIRRALLPPGKIARKRPRS